MRRSSSGQAADDAPDSGEDPEEHLSSHGAISSGPRAKGTSSGHSAPSREQVAIKHGLAANCSDIAAMKGIQYSPELHLCRMPRLSTCVCKLCQQATCKTGACEMHCKLGRCTNSLHWVGL